MRIHDIVVISIENLHSRNSIECDSRGTLLRVVTFFLFSLDVLGVYPLLPPTPWFFLLLNMQLFLIARHMRYADKMRNRESEKEKGSECRKREDLLCSCASTLHFPYCCDSFLCTIHNPHFTVSIVILSNARRHPHTFIRHAIAFFLSLPLTLIECTVIYAHIRFYTCTCMYTYCTI